MQVVRDQDQRISLPSFNGCRCGFLHLETTRAGISSLHRVWMALGLLSLLFVIEIAMSYRSHSLSLLADAGHMLADIAVLGLTLAAAYLARRPASGRATFGHSRVEVLVALINGLSLIGVAIFVVLEVADRWQSPTPPVLGVPMLIGASVGMVVNSLNVGLLYRTSHQNLNVRSAFLHVAVDAASSVGLVTASLIIHFCHWLWIDAAMSLVIASLTGLAAIPLIRESVEVLLEFSPRSLDPAQVKAAIAVFEPVLHVETLHIWTIDSNRIMLSAHLTVSSQLDSPARDQLTRQIQTHLGQEFGIHEATVQLFSQNSLNNLVLHPLLHRSLTDYVLQKT